MNEKQILEYRKRTAERLRLNYEILAGNKGFRSFLDESNSKTIGESCFDTEKMNFTYSSKDQIEYTKKVIIKIDQKAIDNENEDHKFVFWHPDQDANQMLMVINHLIKQHVGFQLYYDFTAKKWMASFWPDDKPESDRGDKCEKIAVMKAFLEYEKQQ